MKQEAYNILKSAIEEHREVLLSGKQPCLGLLRDYGGREHPEVNLLADAVEDNIPDRLLRSQPVTQQIIDGLAGDFASKRLYDSQAAKFVVSSWADALGLLTLEPSILTNSRPSAEPDPESSTNEPTQPVERNWHYQNGTNTIGPLPESQLKTLCMSGRLRADSLVWSEGMSEWDKASTYFVVPPLIPTANDITKTDALGSAAPPPPLRTQARPWTRFFARYIDILLFSIIFGITLGIVTPGLLEVHGSIIGILLILAFVFAEPLMFSIWGTTPGKWLLMIQVRNLDGTRMTYSKALERAFNVWIKGLGLGIPIVTLFTELNSYNTLKKTGVTSWDKDRFSVTHGNIAGWKIAVVVILILIFIVLVETP
jgi:uncharacterized RDD family membrane protein YckC